MLLRFLCPSFLIRWPKVRDDLQLIPICTANIIVVLFIAGLFYDPVIVSEPLTWNWRMIGELNVGMDWEGDDCGVTDAGFWLLSVVEQ